MILKKSKYFCWFFFTELPLISVAASSPSQLANAIATVAKPTTTVTTLTEAPIVATPVIAVPKDLPSPVVNTKHTQQQMIQESEQFAYAWLRATIEPVSNLSNRIEQQELYKMYTAASQKIGRRGILSPVHFPRCVRTVFGGTVGPNQVKADHKGVELIQFQYEGLKVKANPQQIQQKPSPQVRTKL